MRLIVVGQKWLGEQALRLCQERGYDVAAVVVPGADDRLARAAGMDGVHVDIVSGRLLASQLPAGCELIVCAHARAFITAEARHQARLGAIGYHPSLLPRHRGRDAVRWALHMREQMTGGTVYWMDDGADTGPIAAQDWCWIDQADTPETLWRDKLAPMGVRLIGQVLDQISAGHYPMKPQDPALATWEPSFNPKPLSAKSAP